MVVAFVGTGVVKGRQSIYGLCSNGAQWQQWWTTTGPIGVVVVVSVCVHSIDIVGIGIGIVVVAFVTVLLLLVVRRRRKSQNGVFRRPVQF